MLHLLKALFIFLVYCLRFINVECLQVVVIDSNSNREIKSNNMALDTSDENESGAAFLIRILKYLETPQYLRKALFPRHNSLRFVVRKPICWKRMFQSWKSLIAVNCFKWLWIKLGFTSTLQGMLPPLDAPHHLRKHEWASFREGCVFSVLGSFRTFVDIDSEALFFLLLRWSYLR